MCKELASLGIDVGGTNIKGASVTKQAELLQEEVVSVPANSEEESGVIIDSLIAFSKSLKRFAEKMEYTVCACGVAFPGPFDYELGISWMEHKFSSIRGIPLTEPLEEALGIPVFFLNDANAFGLGAITERPQDKRILAIPIGTGLGAAFLVDGIIREGTDGAPPDGEIWNFPIGQGQILEDRISKRAIEGVFRTRGGDPLADVREISELARKGNPAARAAFFELATSIGKGLAPLVKDFRPDVIILGGQISKACDLFLMDAKKVLQDATGFEVTLATPEKDHLAVIGVARFALERSAQK